MKKFTSSVLPLALTILLVCLLIPTDALAASWPMKQRDIWNTGRADFSVPENRLNGLFFDIFKWQTPTPGSPVDGGVSSTQMTFYDKVGPKSADIVVGGYHWPKGVQGMDRWTGAIFWQRNPAGGETIGRIAPAFANNGRTIYVVNDATGSSEYPDGFPLMAFATVSGPASFRHNGSDPNPWKLSIGSPKILPDGRIFLGAWNDRPYGGTDDGSAILTTWDAASRTGCIKNEPAFYQDGSVLKVIAAGRDGRIYCFNGTTGTLIWSRTCNTGTTDASPTIDPSNGNIYVASGSDSIWVIGLNKNGNPLWGSDPAVKVFNRTSGQNPQFAESTGCLRADGQMYYFQTNSQEGDGKLYAFNVSTGTLSWTYDTEGKGWSQFASSPIVTQNGVVVVGNNEGKKYFAIKDEVSYGSLIDTLEVDAAGNANASATISPDGMLYLPLRTIWSTPNGTHSGPTFQVANMFTCIDLNSDASVILPPPPLRCTPLNRAVQLNWSPVIDLTGQFAHYAVYRSLSPFSSVAGMIPIATVPGVNNTGYLDAPLDNNVGYYYAVTSVSATGGEIKTVKSIGPFIPKDETDLQVLTVSRTPRYPRYAAMYTGYQITEPSGYGPYIFSASTHLGQGQTENTKRWPDIGESCTYTATVRNRGTNTWNGALTATWMVDGVVVSTPSKIVALAPGDMTTFTYVKNWDGESHDITFTINVTDARPNNNSLTVNTKSVAFLTYIDKSFVEQFAVWTSTKWPTGQTDDIFDWLNRHMKKFNQMFAAAGTQKRVHYGILEPIDDNSPDPSVNTIEFAIFPFRYRVTDGDPRSVSAYFRINEDIDYGLLHEMGHQLGLIDIYRMDIAGSQNQVSGLGYSAPECLMRTCGPVLSEFSALAMEHWLDVAHGYYGQFMYNLPTNMQLKIIGQNGSPLAGAVVTMYQKCERPGLGEAITDQVKAQGVTDSNGIFVLPNVPIDPSKVPPAHTGDTLHPNPFGYIAIVGTNGLLHFKIEYKGDVDYCWLDLTEPMVAYFRGETELATFEREVALGGQVQFYPPDDLAELNANDWAAWAEGSSPGSTYTEDDTVRKIVGNGSVKFVTDGALDTLVRYPRTLAAHWDLRKASTLQFSVYAENPSVDGFQNGSPWIRLKDSNGNYFQYQYYIGGNVADILNQARKTWKTWEVPIGPTGIVENGWRRTTFGTPDISKISSVEFHADTWGNGFRLWYDGVRFIFPSEPVIGIANAKVARDNSRVDISDAAVSAAWPGVFYIQSFDRHSGIRVEKADHTMVAGATADVKGFITTNKDGERTIDASWAAVTGELVSVKPLFMSGKSIGGSDYYFIAGTGAGQRGVEGGIGLNNIGLLIKASGVVVDRDNSINPSWYIIHDGSPNKTTKVIVQVGTRIPPIGTFVTVTGVSSCYREGPLFYSRILAK